MNPPVPASEQAPFSFPLVTLEPGETSKTTYQASHYVFRPVRLLVAVGHGRWASPTDRDHYEEGEDDTSALAITKIFVGSESCLVNDHPLSVKLFELGGVDAEVAFPAIAPEIYASITLVDPNRPHAKKDLEVLCSFLGYWVGGNGVPFLSHPEGLRDAR